MAKRRYQQPEFLSRLRSPLLLLVGLIFALAGAQRSFAGGNGIDRIEPSVPGYVDDYIVSVDSAHPTVSFTQTGILPRVTFDGIRDISLDVNGGTSAFSSKLYGDTFLSLENDANTSAILTLDYGNQMDLNRNFLWQGHFNAIGIDVAAVSSGVGGIDLGSGSFMLTLRSGSTIGTATAPISFNSPGEYFFLYSDPGFAGINFADIDQVTLTLLTTTPGTDFRIESIYRCSVVPEPSSYALFVAGLAVLGWLSRNRFARA
jgi:hypothetical protein